MPRSAARIAGAAARRNGGDGEQLRRPPRGGGLRDRLTSGGAAGDEGRPRSSRSRRSSLRPRRRLAASRRAAAQRDRSTPARHRLAPGSGCQVQTQRDRPAREEGQSAGVPHREAACRSPLPVAPQPPTQATAPAVPHAQGEGCRRPWVRLARRQGQQPRGAAAVSPAYPSDPRTRRAEHRLAQVQRPDGLRHPRAAAAAHCAAPYQSGPGDRGLAPARRFAARRVQARDGCAH